MPDLVIGNNTYNDIQFIKVKRTNGSMAIFHDSSRQDYRTPFATISSVSGKPIVHLDATLYMAASSASIRREI